MSGGYAIIINKVDLKYFKYKNGMEGEMMKGGRCSCPPGKLVPVLVVLFGLGFLLQALDVLSTDFMAIAWPILVILAGLITMYEKMCKNCYACGACGNDKCCPPCCACGNGKCGSACGAGGNGKCC